MKKFFLFCLISFVFSCVTVKAQITGQGKPIHGQYDALEPFHQGLIFNVNKPFMLISVEAWSAGPEGFLLIELQESTTRTVMETIKVQVPKGSIKNPVRFVIDLNWMISPGKYHLISSSESLLMYDYLPETGGSFPYPIGKVGSIISGLSPEGIDDRNYYFFYNWTIRY